VKTIDITPSRSDSEGGRDHSRFKYEKRRQKGIDKTELKKKRYSKGKRGVEQRREDWQRRRTEQRTGRDGDMVPKKSKMELRRRGSHQKIQSKRKGGEIIKLKRSREKRKQGEVNASKLAGRGEGRNSRKPLILKNRDSHQGKSRDPQPTKTNGEKSGTKSLEKGGGSRYQEYRCLWETPESSEKQINFETAIELARGPEPGKSKTGEHARKTQGDETPLVLQRRPAAS